MSNLAISQTTHRECGVEQGRKELDRKSKGVRFGQGKAGLASLPSHAVIENEWLGSGSRGA